MAGLYSPLGERDFRLLCPNGDGSSYSMRQSSLDNAPQYACLSYLWQDEDGAAAQMQRYQIVVNESTISIGKNLDLALRHLWTDVHTRGLMLWVDALCINQEDLVERAVQVTLMKTLFEQACRIYAWIGVPYQQASTKSAVDMMQKLSKISPEFYRINHEAISGLNCKADQALDTCIQLLRTQSAFSDMDDRDILEAWASMIALFKRKYWARTWVHQEVILPNVTFHCGLHQFTPKEVHAVSSFHCLYGGFRQLPESFLLMFSGGQNVGSPFLDLFNSQTNRRLIGQGHIDIAKLGSMIRELRLTSCSDARDKVFAALPHVTGWEATETLAVDYTRSLLDVYIAVVQLCLLRAEEGLQILGYVCKPTASNCDTASADNSCRLPTWVPDWRAPSRIRPLNSVATLHGAYPLIFNPCPGTSLMNNVRIVGLELHVTGFIFDELENTTPTAGHEESPPQIERWAYYLEKLYPTLSTEAINRSLVADACHVPEDSAGGLTSNVRGNVADWALVRSSIKALDTGQGMRRWCLLHTLRGVVRDRRGGVTKNQRPGIFPEHSRPGDKVAALYGGNALYLLRPAKGYDDRYQFLGECYVDEMMDGQAVELATANGIPVSTLILV